MEFFSCQSPAINVSHGDNISQFEWNPMAGEPYITPEVPRDLPDDLTHSIFTSDQISALLTAYDSSSSAASFPTDFPPECLHQAFWDLPLYPEAVTPSAHGHNPFVPQPLEPMCSGSTTYRNGFGDPILPVDYRPNDGPWYWEDNSTTSTGPSGIQSPSESYPAYTYPSVQLNSEIPNLGASSLTSSTAHSPCLYSGSSDVGSVGNFPVKPVKKHRCQICGRAFQRQTTLTQHQITHTGERPYACPVAGCDKAFTTASNAKRHAKIHFRMSHNYHHYASSSPGPY